MENEQPKSNQEKKSEETTKVTRTSLVCGFLDLCLEQMGDVRLKETFFVFLLDCSGTIIKFRGIPFFWDDEEIILRNKEGSPAIFRTSLVISVLHSDFYSYDILKSEK